MTFDELPQPSFRTKPLDDWPSDAVASCVEVQNLLGALGGKVTFCWDGRVGTVVGRRAGGDANP